jgi:hypothetical protein
MTPTNDPRQANEDSRLRDQLRMIDRANPGSVDPDSRKAEEFTHAIDRNRVLFAESDVDVETVQGVFRGRQRDFRGRGRVVGNPIPGLVLYELPLSRGLGRRDAKSALGLIEESLQAKVVFPDHFLHVSPNDNGRPCPATEPEETGTDRPWPRRTGKTDAGRDVLVAVVDTGRHRPCEQHPTTPWLSHDVHGDDEPLGADLHEYAGHGAFIAGVVRCRAPKATIHHERFRIGSGGAIRESAIIAQLNEALDKKPHVINLSAGTHTLSQDPLKSFEVLWDTRLKNMPDTVLVAAAGNDGSDKKFYPAAFPWAVGVGSLDRSGQISSFSNWGSWVDVFAIGRNHVNAFPEGRYVCKETPDKGDVRKFSNGLARWSGTSFAAPVVAGILAAMAAERPAGTTVRQVKDQFMIQLLPGSDTHHGVSFSYVPRPYR